MPASPLPTEKKMSSSFYKSESDTDLPGPSSELYTCTKIHMHVYKFIHLCTHVYISHTHTHLPHSHTYTCLYTDIHTKLLYIIEISIYSVKRILLLVFQSPFNILYLILILILFQYDIVRVEHFPHFYWYTIDKQKYVFKRV